MAEAVEAVDVVFFADAVDDVDAVDAIDAVDAVDDVDDADAWGLSRRPSCLESNPFSRDVFVLYYYNDNNNAL